MNSNIFFGQSNNEQYAIQKTLTKTIATGTMRQLDEWQKWSKTYNLCQMEEHNNKLNQDFMIIHKDKNVTHCLHDI